LTSWNLHVSLSNDAHRAIKRSVVISRERRTLPGTGDRTGRQPRHNA
jgi:hypothetical protein